MTEEPLTVRPELLGGVARALDDDAYRLAHGLVGVPGLMVPAPDWRAGAALVGLESAVHGWLGRLGGLVAATGGAVRTAVESYRAVDDRAARRLAALPR
ncbi:hypothetical protein [Micromonospora sp. NPDC049301]|uniref:hypothetical protein n=1 Tax=Micromonospora sp. NPDC049301 TaxID=3155723 RepID=UPI00341A1243